MVYFLYTVFFVSCVLLIASVLLQPGKTDAGALFTSNISSTAFQPRGSQTILSKITIAAATIFMLSALMLAMPALNGGVSVLETVADTPTEATPATDANANVANSNAATDANVSTNISNLPSNVAVMTNSNEVSNIVTNANTAANVASNANTAANTATNANR